MRTWLLVAGATGIAAVLSFWSWQQLGLRSLWFAFVIVWLPMTWLGTISRLVTPRLPARIHDLREFERDGRVYELLGVRIAKRLLRRGPISAFNRDLHLPSEPTPAGLAHLDQRMRDAEASHLILFVLTLGLVAYMLARGWWASAAATALFDLLLNGYPVMLQRYNRVRLALRFRRDDGPSAAVSTPGG